MSKLSFLHEWIRDLLRLGARQFLSGLDAWRFDRGLAVTQTDDKITVWRGRRGMLGGASLIHCDCCSPDYKRDPSYPRQDFRAYHHYSFSS